MDDAIEIWRERLRQAQEKYTEASAIAAKIQKEYALGPHSPDGERVLQQAIRTEMQARDEYRMVLRTLNRVLEGG